MLERIPSQENLESLIGANKLKVWTALCEMIDSIYDMDCLWNAGGKKWTYEYKYRRGGKTLCALYAKDNCTGFMIILGKAERDKFDAQRKNYSLAVQNFYDEATTYHDGKWIMFEMDNTSNFDDFKKLLAIKRKPNKNNEVIDYEKN